MKKTILTLGMLCLLSLCGCAGSQRTADNWGITLRAEDAGPTGVTLTCSKNADSDTCSVQTGTQFWLERREGGVWTPVTPTEALAWTQEIIPKNCTVPCPAENIAPANAFCAPGRTEKRTNRTSMRNLT